MKVVCPATAARREIGHFRKDALGRITAQPSWRRSKLRITRNLKEHLHTFQVAHSNYRISLETLRQTISDLVADAKDRDRQLETFRKSVSGLASDVENFERQVLANVRAIETNQSKIADYRDPK